MKYPCGSVSDVRSIYFYLLSLRRFIQSTVLVLVLSCYEIGRLIL